MTGAQFGSVILGLIEERRQGRAWTLPESFGAAFGRALTSDAGSQSRSSAWAASPLLTNSAASMRPAAWFQVMGSPSAVSVS